MSKFEERLGSDLELLENRRFQDDRAGGSDLKARWRAATDAYDLAIVAGAENISQALLLRFLTPQGELADLGHPTYGSRLHELVGEPNTETNRNFAKLFALQALAGEPRVEKVLSAQVRQRASDRGAVDIDLTLKIVRTDTPLNLVFPFSFDAGANA
jgi:phage baseplate assembly protein W